MKKLSGELDLLAGRFPTDEKTLIARRAVKVQAMWKDAVEHVYKDVAPYVLEHVNAVYVKAEDEVRTLIVYMDDPDFRADVHCRQHLIMLRMQERYGERIDAFKTLPSRFDMKKRHPYKEGASKARSQVKSVPLTAAERDEVDRVCAPIENQALRRALEKAMTTDREWKKGEHN